MKVWIAVGAAFVALFYLLGDILMPFVAGAVIAYLLDPLVDRLEARGFSRTLATSTVTGGFFLLALAILLPVIPMLGSQVASLAQSIPGYKDTIVALANGAIEMAEPYLDEDTMAQLKQAAASVSGSVAGWVAKAAQGALGSGLAFINVVSLLLLTPVVAFYMIRDWDNMVAVVDDHLPRSIASEARKLFKQIDVVIAAYMRGQATVCFALGAFYGIALSLIGLPYGLLIGVVSGLISFVPYLGTATGVVAGLAVAFFHFPEWWHFGAVTVVFVIGQVLEGNFLTPKLVGDSVGLHPVWVIFAILAGGSLMGFTGVLVSVPAAAVAGVLVRYGSDRYKDTPFFMGNLKSDDETN